MGGSRAGHGDAAFVSKTKMARRDTAVQWWSFAQQITEAFPWNGAPRYLIRDRDGVYGPVVRRRLRAMGIRDKADFGGIVVAELFCRTTDWLHPPRMR